MTFLFSPSTSFFSTNRSYTVYFYYQQLQLCLAPSMKPIFEQAHEASMVARSFHLPFWGQSSSIQSWPSLSYNQPSI